MDGSIIVVDAVSGVQAQTQTVWRQVCKQNTPSIAFVNKMDRDGACFERCVDSIKSKLGANAVPIQLPIGSEDSFQGIVDLISMRKFIWDSTQISRTPTAPTVVKLTNSSEDDPDSVLYHEVLVYRKAMLESIAELDEQFMNIYLESDEENLNSKDILDALRRLCLANTLVPTLCGASLRGKGVEPLLDSVLAFLPSPHDNLPFKAIHKGTAKTKHLTADSTDLCALAFKVTYDPARGPLVFARVFSGNIVSKQGLFNSTKNNKERINQLLEVSADDLKSMEQCGPGEVCCIVGLKHTVTGDTLVAEHGSSLHSYVLEGLTIPPPVFSLSIEPEKESLQKDLEAALHILCLEDPSLKIEINKESGQTLIHGLGELHLEIICDRLKQQFNIEVTCGKAYVAYRESLSHSDEMIDKYFTYDRTMGPKRLYAKLRFRVHATGKIDEPKVNIIKEARSLLSADEFNTLQESLESALSRGPRGFPIVGLIVNVTEVHKEIDTTPGALRACASLFIKELLSHNENHILLEPIMSLEIELPEYFVGDVLSDLTVQRRAHIKEIIAGTIHDKQKHLIHATVPLAAMLGYSTSLRSMTQGEGAFTAEYITHLPVDPLIAL